MLRDDLWLQHFNKKDYICLACCEKTLKRKLIKEDLTLCPGILDNKNLLDL